MERSLFRKGGYERLRLFETLAGCDLQGWNRRRRRRGSDDVTTTDKENCEMKKGIFVVLVLLAVGTIPEVGGAATQRERDYLRLVMDIFRSHVEAIELLTGDPGKYSDNVVRHASAIANTAGLLDHAFPGDRNTEGNSHWSWQNEAEFDKLASTVQVATKELAIAAQHWLKDQNRARFMAALEKMKEGCRACHGTARNWP
ncbi:MAG: Cytochrome c' [Rhodospirillaceae bacterium]|nr:MAG: Cytochrome c' [Rhodospirillaceae bacterium]